MKIFLKHLWFFILIFLFVGCSSLNKGLEINQEAKLPHKYKNSEIELVADDDWLLSFKSNELEKIVRIALNSNYKLKQSYYDIKIREQDLVSSRSYLYPELDLSLDGERSGTFESSDRTSSSSIALNLNYEIDFWGKLSDSHKKANLQVLEAKALYEEAKQQLIVNVSLAYFDILESNILLKLYNKNLGNANKSYELINSRYKKGLSNSLDLLQARNSVNDQELKISRQKTIKSNALYTLEKYIGKYPKELENIRHDLPLIKSNAKVGLPSEVIFRKASLNATWNKLLAQNHQLAFTHKQRLPSLNLTASIEQTSQTGSITLWSLLGGITTPLFNSGRLKANKQKAYLELKKIESEYLDSVYSTYVDIEDKIVQEKSLIQQYKDVLDSTDNQKKILELSLSQYLKGLVPYSTLLTNQDRYYNSQEILVQTKKQLLENRIQLHFSLGGDFTLTQEEKEK